MSEGGHRPSAWLVTVRLALLSWRASPLPELLFLSFQYWPLWLEVTILNPHPHLGCGGVSATLLKTEQLRELFEILAPGRFVYLPHPAVCLFIQLLICISLD